MADLYGFSQQSAQRIASAVKKVESMAGDSQQPAYEPETTGAESFVDRHVGTFTGEWAKGTTADVTVTADNGEDYTEEAMNYFADVGEAGAESDCVILQAGSEWVLVSAEARTAIRGTFIGEWAKGASSVVSFVENGVSGTRTSINYFADVGEAGVTSACCIIQAGSEWILIAAECG